MKEILTAEDVAELLSVKSATVRQWVYLKKIPYFHVGRLLRFRLASILEWAAQLEKAATEVQPAQPRPAAKKAKAKRKATARHRDT